MKNEQSFKNFHSLKNRTNNIQFSIPKCYSEDYSYDIWISQHFEDKYDEYRIYKINLEYAIDNLYLKDQSIRYSVILDKIIDLDILKHFKYYFTINNYLKCVDYVSKDIIIFKLKFLKTNNELFKSIIEILTKSKDKVYADVFF